MSLRPGCWARPPVLETPAGSSVRSPLREEGALPNSRELLELSSGP